MSDELLAMFQEALGMFIFLGVELTTLFLLISFLVGVIQAWIPAEKIQSILSSKGGRGYVSAAALGSITPFCSCSTIPMLAGLLKARAGFGPTITFLFTSPLLNPIIIGLFLVTFGWEVTVTYALFALLVSVSAGYFLEKFGFSRYIREEVLAGETVGGCGASQGSSCSESATQVKSSCCPENTENSTDVEICCDGTAVVNAPRFDWAKIWQETWQQFIGVWPYLLIGVAIGAFTYGFIPADVIAEYAGEDNPLAVPIAAVIGIPLYIRAAAVIPLSGALIAKGMALGSVMALIIGSAGASLTEVILLRSLFKTPMIVAFLLIVLGMAISAGFMFNLLF